MTERKLNERWEAIANKILLGRKIVKIRWLSKLSAEQDFGWYKRPIILTLDDGSEILANPIAVKSSGEKTIVSLRPERALINTEEKMENNFKGKIEEVIYHGDHTRVRLNLLGNKDFILKVPNSSANMDIKLGNQINVSWNSFDARALDTK